MHACWRQQALKGHEVENQIEVRQLKEHGIHQLIVMGLIAHACVEATVRYALSLATRSQGKRRDRGLLGCRHAALDINIPNYASAIVTTNEVVEALSFHLRLT